MDNDYPRNPAALSEPDPARIAAVAVLGRYAPANLHNPHNVYIMSDITRSGIGYYSRLFVPALVGGNVVILELTDAISKATGNPCKERGSSLWLYSKGIFDHRTAALLLAQALGVSPEMQSRAYKINAL